MLNFKSMLAHLRNIKDPKLRTAWGILIAADITQLVLFPLFSAGGLSPVDDLLDVVVGVSLTRLLGWHWAFSHVRSRNASRPGSVAYVDGSSLFHIA